MPVPAGHAACFGSLKSGCLRTCKRKIQSSLFNACGWQHAPANASHANCRTQLLPAAKRCSRPSLGHMPVELSEHAPSTPSSHIHPALANNNGAKMMSFSLSAFPFPPVRVDEYGPRRTWANRKSCQTRCNKTLLFGKPVLHTLGCFKPWFLIELLRGKFG